MSIKRINVKVSEEEKEVFYESCKLNMTIPSLVVRKLMKEYVKQGNNIFTE